MGDTAANQSIDETINILKKNSQDLKLNLVDFKINLDKTIEYFLEEVEIRVESLKIELNETCLKINKKLRVLKRNLFKLNNEFHFIVVDEENLFKNVTLYTLDMKATSLNILIRCLKNYLNNKYLFESNKSLTESKMIGKIYREVRFISKKILQEARNGELIINFMFQLILIFIYLALNGIDLRSLTEFRSFRSPPNLVVLTAKALCCIFGWNEEWNTIKKLSARQLLMEIMHLDFNNYCPVRLEKLGRYINMPEFNHDLVYSSAGCCRCISIW